MRKTGQHRPNLIPGGNTNPLLGKPDLYFDVNQFVPSVCFGSRACRAGDPDYQVGYFGNLGQNTLIAPGLATVDFSFNKDFQLTEANRLQFRAELFNRPNFRFPASGVFMSSGARNPQAGRITQT